MCLITITKSTLPTNPTRHLPGQKQLSDLPQAVNAAVILGIAGVGVASVDDVKNVVIVVVVVVVGSDRLPSVGLVNGSGNSEDSVCVSVSDDPESKSAVEDDSIKSSVVVEVEKASVKVSVKVLVRKGSCP